MKLALMLSAEMVKICRGSLPWASTGTREAAATVRKLARYFMMLEK
jgi:hypothetical protein